jgi:hypothetical protein
MEIRNRVIPHLPPQGGEGISSDFPAKSGQTGCGRSGRVGYSHGPGTFRLRRRQHDDVYTHVRGGGPMGLTRAPLPTPDGYSLKLASSDLPTERIDAKPQE